ncbi:hypothetical protein FA10DRAFT_282647 [Acaromyces ingoldii]|uniref:FAD-binding FR-type domain-containing protein n=1 Tax=Acaromyces ingoldii TaxID=215250 RepID=A0A316YWC7_9BASI|nr:hypothetical protein FA10DRAFT_282647 [Acaromyces ingoldii]PWN92968.1 hypothetical protein FA10DRAFT_282647 [Acaromyces ingoldii]
MDGIDSLFVELDTDRDGFIHIAELGDHLSDVYKLLFPHHDESLTRIKAVHAALLPNDAQVMLDRDAFRRLVERQWTTPSEESEEKRALGYTNVFERDLSWQSRIAASWRLSAHRYLFVLAVVACIFTSAFANMLRYLRDEEAMRAFGPGIVVSKAAAGALYPTLFLMVISMSRWLPTYAKHRGILSTFINWDRSKPFHIAMASLTVVFATVHALGHLFGSYRHAARASASDLAPFIQSPTPTIKYASLMRLLPSPSGLFALAFLYTMALCGLPVVRRRQFELFQLSHLLMYPFFGLMMAHGTLRLLQFPILGIVFAPPVLLVLLERLHRSAYRGFFVSHTAALDIVDATTVRLTFDSSAMPCFVPFKAGQYVLLQVPQISRWQWHPFTISSCRGGVEEQDQQEVTLHIRTTAGDWTRRLRELASADGTATVRVGLDGPFAAPSDVFYRYDRTVIVGAGIGATPFSAILQDLSHRWRAEVDPWREHEAKRAAYRLNQLQRGLKRISSSRASSVTGHTVDIPRSRPVTWTNLPASVLSQCSSLASSGNSRASSSVALPTPVYTVDFHPSRPGGPPDSQLRETPPSPQFSIKLEPGQSSLQRSVLSWVLPTSRPRTPYSVDTAHTTLPTPSPKRVDFVWTVRQASDLDWLLPTLAEATQDLPDWIEVHLRPYVTSSASSSIGPAALVEAAIDGAVLPVPVVRGARPHVPALLDALHADLVAQQPVRRGRCDDIGVLFCGPASLELELREHCAHLTSRAVQDGSGHRYFFHAEAF